MRLPFIGSDATAKVFYLAVLSQAQNENLVTTVNVEGHSLRGHILELDACGVWLEWRGAHDASKVSDCFIALANIVSVVLDRSA